jgi:hypothetical protein
MADDPTAQAATAAASQTAVGAVVRGKDYQTVFSNNSRMRLSPTEIALTFGYTDQLPGSPAPFNEEKVTVVFTPQHAKLLTISLAETIKIFEANYGPINIDTTQKPLSQDALLEAIKKATAESPPKP